MKLTNVVAVLLTVLQGTSCFAQTAPDDSGGAVMEPLITESNGHTARPRVVVLLKAAQAHIQEKKHEQALEELSEIDAIGDLTDWERFLQARVRASAAAISGDDEAVMNAFRAVVASPYLPAHERLLFEKGMAGIYISTKQYARFIDDMSAGILAGGDAELQGYLVQAYYQSDDFKNASLVQGAILRSPAGADKAMNPDEWALLASSCSRANDRKCSLDALEKIASLEYSVAIMRDALARIAMNGSAGDRMQLELYRLQQRISPLRASELLDFGRLLLLSGAPIEANVLIETAFKNGTLGTGTDAARHARLRAIVAREYARSLSESDSAPNHFKQAKQFDKVAGLGYDLVQAGQTARGIELIEVAIASGELRDMNAAKLHLGLAYLAAGRRADAVAQLNSIPGDDGLAQLGRFWIIQDKQRGK